VRKGATYEPEMQVIYQLTGNTLEGPKKPTAHAGIFHAAGLALDEAGHPGGRHDR
jgi:hypothetical protein